MNYSNKTAHSSKAEQHSLQQLVSQVESHPHKDELIEIMYQQVLEDTYDLGNISHV